MRHTCVIPFIIAALTARMYWIANMDIYVHSSFYVFASFVFVFLFNVGCSATKHTVGSQQRALRHFLLFLNVPNQASPRPAKANAGSASRSYRISKKKKDKGWGMHLKKKNQDLNAFYVQKDSVRKELA